MFNVDCLKYIKAFCTSCTHIDCINDALISMIQVHTGSSKLAVQKDTMLGNLH